MAVCKCIIFYIVLVSIQEDMVTHRMHIIVCCVKLVNARYNSNNTATRLADCKAWSIKATQPESGDLCGNITEFGVAEGSPEPTKWRWSFLHHKRSDIAIQISRKKLFCFYIVLFNDFISFSAKVYEINMYLLLYLSFKIQMWEYAQLHYNTILFMWCIITSDVIIGFILTS